MSRLVLVRFWIGSAGGRRFELMTDHCLHWQKTPTKHLMAKKKNGITGSPCIQQPVAVHARSSPTEYSWDLGATPPSPKELLLLLLLGLAGLDWRRGRCTAVVPVYQSSSTFQLEMEASSATPATMDWSTMMCSWPRSLMTIFDERASSGTPPSRPRLSILRRHTTLTLTQE